MPGLTDEGFEIETLLETLDGITTAQRDPDTGIDPNVDNSPESLLGTLNATMAERYRDLWELALATYGAMYPSQARGQALSYGAQLTGTIRQDPKKSKVVVTVNLDPDVTLTAGDAVHVVGRPLDRYEIPAGVSVTNEGEDPADFEIEFEASEAGSGIRANSGTLTVIATPKAGWNSATNPLDSVPGKDEEEDTALRIRRIQELNGKSGATYDRMWNQLSQLEDVTAVEVIENSSIVWDKGLPPKSFEALVLGGDDQEIVDTIWQNKPHGIEAFGALEGTANDFAGNPRTVRYSRPTVVDIYVKISVRRGRGYPGGKFVREAIVDAAQQYGIGSEIILQVLKCAPLHLDGVTDVPFFAMGLSSVTLVGANLQMGTRETPRFDTSNIQVLVI